MTYVLCCSYNKEDDEENECTHNNIIIKVKERNGSSFTYDIESISEDKRVINEKEISFTFNSTDGDIDIKLVGSKFTMIFSSYGGYSSGSLENEFLLTKEETKQFRDELLKLNAYEFFE